MWGLLCALFIGHFSGASWSANDVSILLPLPKTGEELELLSPQMGKNFLLPADVFTALPDLVMDITPKRVYQQALKVVAIRIDPCFGSPCKKQIRLVWQPIVFLNSAWTTRDAAIHTFYTLDEKTWETFIKEYEPLKLQKPDNSLTVHPILLSEGYKGPHWKKLKDLLIKYCNTNTLDRATAMTVNQLGTVWIFTGFDISQNSSPAKFITLPIPGMSDDSQGFFASPNKNGTKQFVAALSPAPSGQDSFLKLLRDSRSAPTKMTEDEIVEAARRALQLENPLITSPTNADCASCHVAHAVTSWTARQFPQWDWLTKFPQEMYKKTAAPQPVLRGADVLRAYGYFESDPIISRRVEHETMEVLKKMNP